jgi:hypothetical protein
MGLFKKIKQAAGGTDSALLENGRLGRGVIVGCQMTGTAVTMGVDEYRVCELAVQVFLDGEQPYVAQCRQRIPEWLLPQIQAGGATAAVRVSPTNPQEIAVDLQTEAPVVQLAKPPEGQGADHVLKFGVPAEGVIVQNAPLGVRNWEGHDVHLFTITVIREGQNPYQAQLGNPLPAAGLPLVFPGSKLPVKVDPNEPNSVVIDWDAAIAGG